MRAQADDRHQAYRDRVLFTAIALALGQIALACALPAAHIWGFARFALATGCFPPVTLRLARVLVDMTYALTGRVARRVHEPTASACGVQGTEVCPIVPTNSKSTAPAKQFPGKNRKSRAAAGYKTAARMQL